MQTTQKLILPIAISATLAAFSNNALAQQEITTLTIPTTETSETSEIIAALTTPTTENKETTKTSEIIAVPTNPANEDKETSKETPATTPLSGNLTIASDYRFRGISQTFKQPTIQGGFDYAHSSGLYVGNWNSNVSGNSYQNGGSLEMDLYGGYKFSPIKDVTTDIGLLYYYYPSASIATTNVKYNNGEIYFGSSYKWFSAKYSYGLTDFFGLKDSTAAVYAFSALTLNGGSKGSGYLDLNANFEVMNKTTLTLHAGRQTVKNYGALNYTDYKIGITRDLGFATLGFAVITTNADKNLWKVANGAGTSKELGTTTAIISISKAF